MKRTINSIFIFFLSSISVLAQKLTVQSPNQKVNVALNSVQNADAGEWFLKASFNNNGKISEAISKNRFRIVEKRPGLFQRTEVFKSE